MLLWFTGLALFYCVTLAVERLVFPVRPVEPGWSPEDRPTPFQTAARHSSEWLWASQLSERWGSAGRPLVSAASSLLLTKLTLQLWLLTYTLILPTSPSQHQRPLPLPPGGQNREPVVSRQVKAGAEPCSQHPSEVMGQRLGDGGWGRIKNEKGEVRGGGGGAEAKCRINSGCSKTWASAASCGPIHAASVLQQSKQKPPLGPGGHQMTGLGGWTEVQHSQKEKSYDANERGGQRARTSTSSATHTEGEHMLPDRNNKLLLLKTLFTL